MFGSSAGSADLTRQFVNPYPTAELYTDNFCSQNAQSIGIAGKGTIACTNAACCEEWQSGYLYYDC